MNDDSERQNLHFACRVLHNAANRKGAHTMDHKFDPVR